MVNEIILYYDARSKKHQITYGIVKPVVQCVLGDAEEKSRRFSVVEPYITAGFRTLYLSNTSLDPSISCCTVVLIKRTEEPQVLEKIERAWNMIARKYYSILEYCIFRFLTHLCCRINVTAVGNSSQFHMKGFRSLTVSELNDLLILSVCHILLPKPKTWNIFMNMLSCVLGTQ